MADFSDDVDTALAGGIVADNVSDAVLALLRQNGNLGIENINTGEPGIKGTASVQAQQTQRGTFVESHARAGTANLDFRTFWFSSVGTPENEISPRILSNPQEAQFIPGGNVTFYVPRQSAVLLQWTAMWGNDAFTFTDDGGLTSQSSVLYLVFDDQQQLGHWRRVRQSVQVSLSGGNIIDPHRGYRRNRVWSGSALLPGVQAGWHSAGLKLYSDLRIPNTRIWTRSIKALVFPGPGTPPELE